MTLLTVVTLLIGGGETRVQEYQVRITDFAVLRMLWDGDLRGAQDGALANGLSKALGDRVTPERVLSWVKELGDFEVLVRSRPRWRRDADPLKKARGFYELRLFLHEQIGPLRELDYTLAFIEEGGARTTVRSELRLDVRRFGPAHGDRLILVVANIPRVHAFINRVATRMVQAAEWAAINLLVEEYRRERAERRPINR